MKNKKGFTLVEVLGVVVLIAIIFLISYTTILNHFKRSQDKIDENTFSLLKSATKDYMNDNQDDYPENNKNVFCIDVNTLIDNNYIDEDTVVSKDNKLLAKTMKVSYKDNDNEYQLVDSSKCKEKRINPNEKNFIKYLLNNVNDISITTYEPGSDDSHQMYTFEHPATKQTLDLIDYRYIGDDPYNYVTFNYESWRIIGIFTVEDEQDNKLQTVKIIKDEKLPQSMAWNDSPRSILWASSTSKNYLNNQYYEDLNSESQDMIVNAKNYLGWTTYDSNTGFGNADEIYQWERGRSVINANTRISVMYPSDYVYTYAYGVDNNCYKNISSCTSFKGANPASGWLYKSDYSQMLISRYGGPYNTMMCSFSIVYYGSISYGSMYHKYGVRPVLYLKPEVKIVSGDGTKDNPYKLSM